MLKGYLNCRLHCTGGPNTGHFPVDGDFPYVLLGSYIVRKNGMEFKFDFNQTETAIEKKEGFARYKATMSHFDIEAFMEDGWHTVIPEDVTDLVEIEKIVFNTIATADSFVEIYIDVDEERLDCSSYEVVLESFLLVRENEHELDMRDLLSIEFEEDCLPEFVVL